MYSVCNSYPVSIFVGTRVGRTANKDAIVHSIQRVYDICRKYCDEIGLCVSVTPTEFIYKGGQESGAIVGLINYPRFKMSPMDINQKALELARLLLLGMEQMVVSVQNGETTYLLEGKDFGGMRP